MRNISNIRKEFLEECRESLSYLTDKYGFIGPEPDDHYPSDMEATYYKNDIAIECNLDVRDEDIMTYITHLVGGKKPLEWRVNENGQVVREAVFELLKGRGARDRMYSNMPDMSKLTERRASMRKDMISTRRLLEKYGQDILAGSARIFEEYNQGRDK